LHIRIDEPGRFGERDARGRGLVRSGHEPKGVPPATRSQTMRTRPRVAGRFTDHTCYVTVT
jgi:hypothetical protein